MYPDYDDGPPDSFLASALRFAGWLLLIALASALIHWFTGSPYTPGGDAMP